MTDSVFSKIIRRELPADIVFEDEHCIAFKDIQPAAPVHLLLVPKKPIINLAHLSEGDQTLMGHMMMMAPKIAADAGIEESFRLITNTGASAGQTVFHLHFHIIGGKNMGALLPE